MAKRTYAIMGATGHIGHELTEELLRRGHMVRALGRDARKLEMLKAKGAEIHSGDFTDHTLLAKAFKGCDAIFSFLPPGMDSDDIVEFRDKMAHSIVQAFFLAKIKRVVNLSSVGGNLLSGTGVIKILHREEEMLNMIDKLNVIHLRPEFFMENLLGFIPLIKSSGVIASPIKKDLMIPMVATRDIGLKAAEFLDALDFTGSKVFDFAGPEDLSMEKATKIIGKAIGKPDLKYTQLSYAQAEKEMIASGMKHQTAKLMIEMNKAFNEGQVKPTQKLTKEHRGTTTLEEFAKTFAQIYNSIKKAA